MKVEITNKYGVKETLTFEKGQEIGVGKTILSIGKKWVRIENNCNGISIETIPTQEFLNSY
jgi:hypothetical protein